MRAYIERLKARPYALLSVLAVVGIAATLYWNLARATDLMLADEAFYLGAGARFLHTAVLPNFRWSPLYAVWYAAHIALCQSPIAAYYAQVYVTVMLTAVVVYGYLRWIETPTPFAMLGAVLWIAQPAYIVLDWGIGWPRPYHFVFLIFLAGAAWLRKCEAAGSIPVALVGASFFLLAAAVRNEYFISMPIFVVWMGALPLGPRAKRAALLRRREYGWPIALLLGTATALCWMNLRARFSPGDPDSNRLWSAFGQHYSVYDLAKSGGKSGLNPWDDWQLVMGRVFPGAHSFLTAAMANPRAFAAFELHNVVTAPHAICNDLALYQISLPYGLTEVLMACVAVVLVWLIASTRRSVQVRALRTTRLALGPYVLSGAAAAAPAVLIAPKVTYMLPFLFVLFAAAVKWFSVILEEKLPSQKSLVGLAAVLMALMTALIPSPFDVRKDLRKPIYQEIAEIEEILEATKREAVPTLQSPGIYVAAFLPYGATETVDALDRRENEKFWEFVRRTNIRAALVDDRLRANRLYRDDADFAQFLRSPKQFGWTSKPVGMRGDVFYLRSTE
jgi:hypothetical protein